MALRRRSQSFRPSRKWMVIMALTGIVALTALGVGYRYYRWFFASNIITPGTEAHYIYIPNGAEFDEVMALLQREKILKSTPSFHKVAQLMKYPSLIKGGRYRVRTGMSNYELVSALRAGKQSPVKLTFTNIRTKADLAHVVSQKLMTDSAELVKLLHDNDYLKQYDATSQTALARFIPNSYELYWNTDAKGFVERMHKEYRRFWSEQRTQQAQRTQLTPDEISTLASIVDEETQKNDEKPIVAGLYLNRLKKRMLLQADPTVKFALGDFTIKRILHKDLEIDSPYNTYKYVGLPPGPIRIPSITAIDAVLNAQQHDYLYMCAREDFSGYHNFAKSLAQHNVNAAKYRKALKERNIWR
ncbi:UPF0755 protein [Breznakibacter xylanolyticus]|uniref:Endolytic murein transglycosylase n=1 Tax=Breznakibacter xylanolyticus TaxID=990 RepID=A0A2W7N2U4_9BACT|nr:endolytic transglycosylase MltG [Breznakibacter xylanolyticus]PZX14390.1 UPF0755 protein [Breznakibacter xylanolyticus]